MEERHRPYRDSVSAEKSWGRGGEATKGKQHHKPKKGIEKYHVGEDSEAFHETTVRADNYTCL